MNPRHRPPFEGGPMGRTGDCTGRRPQILAGRQENRCTQAVGLDKSTETKLPPLATWVLSASAAPFRSLWILVLVLALPLLTLGLFDPLHPRAAPSTPRLLRAHPRQRGSPHFVVAERRHLARETQGRARVCGGSAWRGISARGRGNARESILVIHAVDFTVIECISGLVVQFAALVLFVPPGPFVRQCGTHVAVRGHGAAGPRQPSPWNRHN